jgi:3-oxoacyl-[acyl-carrier-protein] synthase II
MSAPALLVRGIGVVGGFGAGKDALARFLSDPSAAAPVEEIGTPPGVTLQAVRADLGDLARFADKRALRRIDRYSRLAMLAAHLAVEEGGRRAPLGGRTGLVIASGFGATSSSFAFLDTIIDFGDPIASPTHFSASVHNAAAANVSMSLGIGGPNLTVSDGGLSLSAALLEARRLLAEGACDEVLLGTVDEFCEIYGLAQAEAEPEAAARPLGEGAAFFRLAPAGSGEGYGVIESAAMGTGTLPCPTGALVLADGDLPLPEGTARLSLRERWGRFPTSAGLDLAAALLAVSGRARLPAPSPLSPERAWVAERETDGGWGLVSVARGEARK